MKVAKGTSTKVRLIRNSEFVAGCWEWRRSLTKDGYGRIDMLVKHGVSYPRMAHRISYETFVGPIPEGLQIDHLCRNRSCINPDHLEPVTAKENIRRSRVSREAS